ncbi:MAG: MFS transporter [Verrucomicrobia bacterium]|nr:MFS transporter [Verrucomicrobiota bacterium]
MQKPLSKNKRQISFLPLLLSYILIDETCDNFIFNVFSTNQTSFHEFVFYTFFLLLSIIASPLQSGYSDFYCRRKSLIFSLSLSLIGLVFAFVAAKQISAQWILLLFAIVAKGGLGNNLPLTWAAISDTQEKNFRYSLALSTAMMAFGFFFIILMKKVFNLDVYIIFLIIFMLLGISIYLAVKKFYDIRDKGPENQNNEREKHFSLRKALWTEMRSIINDFLKDHRIRKALLTFMLWEISFYTALIIDVDMHIAGFNGLSLSMMVGYILGVIVLRFLDHKTDFQTIKIGYNFSILSLLIIPFLWNFFDGKVLIIIGYFGFSFAAAFLAPSLFSILSKERKSTEQGKIYGIIDSSDTIAFLLASIITILYNVFKVPAITLPIFSLVVFLVSVWSYEKFKKLTINN